MAKILASPNAVSFFEFDGRTPLMFGEGSPVENISVCDLYMNSLTNPRLNRNHVKKKRFEQITMTQRIKLRHAKRFKVTPDLMNWIFEHRIMGPKVYEQRILKTLEKGYEEQDAELQHEMHYKRNMDDSLPCFDNMFIEFPNCPWRSKDNTNGYTLVGYHIFPKKDTDMVYYFRRIYFDDEKILYQLPILFQIDFLGEGDMLDGRIVPDKLWKSMTNQEALDAFNNHPGTSGKMKEFSDIYVQEVHLCLMVLEVLNYDWIEPRKVERKKGSEKRSFDGFKKGDSFETMEVGLPKERGHQIRDQVFVDGVGIPKRRHEVRGHIRRYKDGRKVWVKSHERGDLSMGRVHKEYILKKAG